MKCLGALASLKGSSSVFNPCSIGGRKIRRSLSQGYPCQNPTSSKIASNIVLATRRGRRFNAFAKKGQTFHRFKAQLSVKHALAVSPFCAAVMTPGETHPASSPAKGQPF